ncbi:hypothetical protein RUE5091_02057 [Ruegeria denitrificans]|uniref:Uncharacterized protein n=1 Tax=Ruegeria denitrificans TaxID=1715692 RepID=A0A0P1I9D6_9RHOB|nr:hypothetical protein RUE5091_02057 [Ruegeria denitrificans]
MSRRRSPNGKRSDEGQYVPMSYAMIKSPAWRALSGPAVKLWLELHTRFNGGNNGKVFLSMNEGQRYWDWARPRFSGLSRICRTKVSLCWSKKVTGTIAGLTSGG